MFKSTLWTRVWWRISQPSTLHLLLALHLFSRWPGNRQDRQSLCSSTSFSFSRVGSSFNFLHSSNLWLVELWTGHVFVNFSSTEGVSCVAPTNSPSTGLPADLREPLLGKSVLVESNLLLSGILLRFDLHIFAYFSSQFANDSHVDRFDFPFTNSAHLPQRWTRS